jgi:hypothetical protein
LPDRIREVWYRREMKMSESWRSCFCLLWDVNFSVS